jgi:hypothetical protein
MLMNALENSFIKDYIREAVDSLSLIFRDLPIEYLINFVSRQVLSKIKDQPVVISNDYTGEKGTASFLEILDWVGKEKPVITPSGAFYVQHDTLTAHPNKMLIEFGERRKQFKKEMYEYTEAHDEENEMLKDLAQKNEKIKMNSYYGAMGQKASYMYLVTCAASITACGRNTISATMWFTEFFLANNLYFDTIDEIFHYILLVLEEDIQLELYGYITEVPEDDKIIAYFLSKYSGNEDKRHLIAFLKMTLRTLKPEHKIKIYYKNNLYRWLDDNVKIRDIFINDIFMKPGDYLNPYSIPKEYAEPMDLTWTLLTEFVMLPKFIAYNKIDKFKERERESVLYSDTDSVFIYVGEWVFKFLEYMRGINKQDINLTELEKEKSLIYKMINCITKHTTDGMHVMFNIMTSNSNVDEKWRGRISIKNETMMGRCIFLNMQKNYIYDTEMTEGHIINPPKFSVKGGNLNAKAKNKLVTDRIKDIVKDVCMGYDKIRPERLLSQLLGFKDEIVSSLANGETKYLGPVKVKSVEEYDNPYSMQNFKGVEIYRLVTTDGSVTLPGAFLSVNVDISTREDLLKIKDSHPSEYTRFIEDVFGNPKLSKGGVNCILIPRRFNIIPSWIMPYIDIEYMVRKHLNPLIALGPSIGISIDTIKSQDYYSTVLRI